MKKKSPPFVLYGAIVFGAIAMILLFRYKQSEDARMNALEAQEQADRAAADAARNRKPEPIAPGKAVPSRNVLYATQPVEPGARLSAAFYEKKSTPNDLLPDAYTDQSDIVGWFAIRVIEKGDPLTPRNIGKSLPYLTQRITPGMRAVSIKVFNAEYNNTGGFVVDGDRVDLLSTTSTQNVEFSLATQFFLQNVKVLYVPGPTIKTDATEGVNPALSPGEQTAVTFEVTPEEAQQLIFFSELKDIRLYMILRARSDTDETKVKPLIATDFSNLILKRVQKVSDKSELRVRALRAEIEARLKAESNPAGTNNETNPPTPLPQ